MVTQSTKNVSKLLLTVHKIHVNIFIIDREAGEIMPLVATVCLFVCLWVCLWVCMSELSYLNGLTYDLHFWYGGRS